LPDGIGLSRNKWGEGEFNVVKVLVENFDIKPTGDVADDVKAMVG
jgi:hydroxylamine reductase (hybrid-cluster protein)